MSPQNDQRNGKLKLIVVLLLTLFFGSWVIWSLLKPVYWYVVAEAINPFRSDDDLDQKPGIPSSYAHANAAWSHEDSALPNSNTSAQTGQTPLHQPFHISGGQGDGVARSDMWRERRPFKGKKRRKVKETDHLIDREMMHEIADKDKYIIITFANEHMTEFVYNWVEHLEILGISSYVIGSMDSTVLNTLVADGIHTFAMQSKFTKSDTGWGTKNFHVLGRKKVELIHIFTEMDLTVILCDADTVWLRNPFPYFKRYKSADILVSSDHLAPTHMDDGLEDWKKAVASSFNIGIISFRPSSTNFAKSYFEYVTEHPHEWDQGVFNTMTRRGMRSFPITDPRNKQRLFLGDDGKVTVGVLPVSIFASGHTEFVSRLGNRMDLEAYVVHAIFQFSGTVGKKNRLREAHLWFDPPEYYDHKVGFLTWDMDVPPQLLHDAAPYRPTTRLSEQQEGHFDLVNHQLVQTRHALAISQALGRAIIIPQFWAGMDRFWAPHAGKIPGAATLLPFKAPLDHFLQLEHSFATPKDRTMMAFENREYSFMDNPRMTDAVRSNKIVVELCASDPPDLSCGDGSAPLEEVHGRVRMRAGLNDRQIQTALSSVNSRYKVMTFTSMVKAFTRHVDRKTHDKFVKRTMRMTDNWCCVDTHPGHVWYDMWWDLKHTDRFNRYFDSWTIRPGP